MRYAIMTAKATTLRLRYTMSKSFKKGVHVKIVHGGDIYRNKGFLDFSANINPFGMPKSVIKAAKKAVEQSDSYPDVFCEELRNGLAKKEGIKSDFIYCGNGAADLIFQICMAEKPKKAVLLSPCFSEYEKALKSVDCAIRYIALKEEKNFCISQEEIDGINSQPFDLIFLCNPNNPTGQLIQKNELKKILSYCEEIGAKLVIDECFLEFTKSYPDYSMADLVKKKKNLIVLKAFTKLYAMPGIRLGYLLCSNCEWIEKMRKCSQAWSVSVPAQKAGIAALEEIDYLEKSKRYLEEENVFLQKKLKKFTKKVYKGEANYVFFQAENNLAEKMKEKKILIRDCSNYRGLKKGFYRISVQKRKENKILLKAWKQIQAQNRKRKNRKNKQQKE